MARKITRRQLLLQIEKLHPPIARAFSEAFIAVRSQAQISRIAEMIGAGRLEMVADELGLDSARFSVMLEEVRNAYIAGGREAASEIPVLRGPGGNRVRVSFEMRNPRAEAWLRRESSRLVTELVADQRNAIRIAVSQGTMLGNNPRQTALDIVGRVGVNGRRTGGIVGLTSQQTQYVGNARAELLSGDPGQMRAYLARTRRDKRFDGAVNKAIKQGRAVAAVDVDKMAGRYADRLLQLRGENIARTEALAAFSEAREEAFNQAVDIGLVKPDNVRKVWSSTGDGRTRESHREMDGQEVGLRDPFNSPTGAQLMHPGDTSMGAGAEDVINCFLPSTPVSAGSILAAIKSHFTGDVVKVSVGGMVDFTVTANHKVLTRCGWVSAATLQEGDELIYCSVADIKIGAKPDVDHVVTTAEKFYDSAKALGRLSRAGCASVDFHGDIADEDVDVVLIDEGLLGNADAASLKIRDDVDLADADIKEGISLFLKLSDRCDLAPTSFSDGSMSIANPVLPLTGSGELCASEIAVGDARQCNTHVVQARVYEGPGASDAARDPEYRISEIVKAPNVIQKGLPKSDPSLADSLPLAGYSVVRVDGIHVERYSGPVFDFQSSNGIILADGIVTHNCRCTVTYRVDQIAEAMHVDV